MQYPNHLVHLYRCEDQNPDGLCEQSDLVLLEDVPDSSDSSTPFHSYYTDKNLVAGKIYEYQIAALNEEGLEGELTSVLLGNTNSIDVIDDLEINPATGRLLLDWSEPSSYAGLDYIYHIINSAVDTLGNALIPNQWADGEIIKTSNIEQTHVPNLVSGQTYCFTVKSVLAATFDGEIDYIDNQQSESGPSNISCSTPGSEYGDALDWNIQIVSEFSDINLGQQLNDIII